MWEYRNTEELYHSDDYLMHYGVLGMKWGHHKYVNNDGTYNDNFKEEKKSLNRVNNNNIKSGLKGIGVGAGLLAASTLPKSKIAKGIIGLNSILPTAVGVSSIATGLKNKKNIDDKKILKDMLDNDLFYIEEDFEKNIGNKRINDMRARYKKEINSKIHNLYYISSNNKRGYYNGNNKITAKEYDKLSAENSKKHNEIKQMFKNEVNKEIKKQGLDKYGIEYKTAEYSGDDEAFHIRLKGNKKYYGN